MTLQVSNSVFAGASAQAECGPLDLGRDDRLEAMAQSLIEMFGDRALSIAQGQAETADAGWNSGIIWRELCVALARNVAS